MLQACLNGNRTRSEHPALPVTPEQLSDAAREAVEAGAEAIHVHVKDADGADTLAPEAVAAALRALRSAVDAPVGVSTGAWIRGDRVAAVGAWSELPDEASVNWHEADAERIAAALLDRGVGVEAGLWDEASAQRWADSPLRDRCRRVLVELPDGIPDFEALRLGDAMVARVAAAAPEMPILFHGEGGNAWPALVYGLGLGMDVRIGLEDTLVMPDGEQAPGNAALVARAAEL